MNENSILNALEYDAASGALSYKDVRYLIIRPETLVGLQKAIEKHSAMAARDAFFQGGYQGGYLSAKKYKEIQNLSDNETIRFMMKMGSEIGWGHFKLDDYDFAQKKMQIRVENSPFAAAYGDSGAGVCHLIRGVLGGLATFLFSRNCIVSETRCLAKGDEHCEFQVAAE